MVLNSCGSDGAESAELYSFEDFSPSQSPTDGDQFLNDGNFNDHCIPKLVSNG